MSHNTMNNVSDCTIIAAQNMMSKNALSEFTQIYSRTIEECFYSTNNGYTELTRYRAVSRFIIFFQKDTTGYTYCNKYYCTKCNKQLAKLQTHVNIVYDNSARIQDNKFIEVNFLDKNGAKKKLKIKVDGINTDAAQLGLMFKRFTDMFKLRDLHLLDVLRIDDAFKIILPDKTLRCIFRAHPECFEKSIIKKWC